MDGAEIYRSFVGRLREKVDSDAKRLSNTEESMGENTNEAQRNRMVGDARFYGKREHETMVRHYNDAISMLAELAGQKSIKLRPKYCPK